MSQSGRFLVGLDWSLVTFERGGRVGRWSCQDSQTIIFGENASLLLGKEIVLENLRVSMLNI